MYLVSKTQWNFGRFMMCCLLYIILTLICLGSAVAYESGTEDNLMWSLDDNGVLRISGNGDLQYHSQYAWYPYTNSIKSVIFESGITGINGNPFRYCKEITSIYIPKSVKSIEDYALFGRWTYDSSGREIACKKCYVYYAGTYSEWEKLYKASTRDKIEVLTQTDDWVLENGVLFVKNTIDMSEIKGWPTAPWCSVREDVNKLILEEGITSIGYQAFLNCINLYDVTIPNTVTYIREEAFSACLALSSIVIPESVTQIEGYVFAGAPCTRNWRIYYLGTKTAWEKTEYRGRCIAQYGKWEIKDGVLTIHASFDMCDTEQENTIPWGNWKNDVVKVVIEEGVETIGKYAFQNMVNLESISIPQSINDINSDAFIGCKLLHEVIIPECKTYGQDWAYNNNYSIVMLKDHPVIEIDERVEPTCTETGLTEGTHCGYCGYAVIAQESIKALGHKQVMDPGYEPTDTQPGLTNGKHCSVCNEILVAQTAIHPKIWGNIKTTSGIAITKYYGDKDLCMVPSAIEGLPVEEISSYAFTNTSASTVYIPENVKKIGNNAFPNNITILCHEYSEADFWATERGYNLTYVDDTENGTFYHLVLPDQRKMEINDSYDLGESFWPKLGNELIYLLSDNPDIVEVDETHLRIIAKTVGETRVTMKVGGVTRAMKVIVHADPTDFSITYNESSEVSLISKKTKKLSISSVQPTGAEMTLVWTSSDTSIVTVSSSGVIEGKRTGTATIYATAQNGLKRSCQVKVYLNCQTHDLVHYPEISVTCTEAGRTEGTMCSFCEEILSGLEEIPALGHDYQLIAEVPASEGVHGVKTYECTRCGERYTEEDEALPYGSVLIGKRWKIVGITQGSRTIPKESWGDFGSMYLLFGDSAVEYMLVNQYGNLKFGLTNWYAEEDGSVYIPEINGMYGINRETATFIIGDDGLFTMILWCPKIHGATFRPLDPNTYAPINLQDGANDYYGTWTADHLYMNDRQERYPVKYWSEFASINIAVKQNGTLTLMGDQANWTYTGGNFFINGQKVNLHVNTLGQLVWQLDHDTSLILVKNGKGALAKPKSFSLPKGLITVEEDAFSGISVEEVVIPQGCLTIGHQAFSNNKELKYIVIPSSVIKIEDDAFSGTDATLLIPEGSRWIELAKRLGMDVLEY